MTGESGRDIVPAEAPLSGVTYFRDRFLGLLGVGLHKLKVAAALVVRSAHLILVMLRFPLRKPYLVLRCNEGRDAAGLFSEFAAVLGLLEHCEKWSRIYAGARVDFKDQGLYFDPAFGLNWWEYYFEPVAIGSRGNAVTKVVSAWQHDLFAWRIEQSLSRREAAELVARHVRVRPEISEKVETFVRQYFRDFFVIGIHYRGTDKEVEAPRVPYDAVFAAVRDVIASIKTDRYHVFVATDEQAFLDHMLKLFPDKLNYSPAVRSVDGGPVHVRDGNNHKKGEEAVIDCLLLSRTDFLIRTESDLSLCAALFNPELPQIVLNRAYS